MEQLEPKLEEGLIRAITAFLHSTECKEIIRANERIRAQQSEISRLHKTIETNARKGELNAEQRATREIAKPGAQVLDGFGRSYEIATIGPDGFIDTEGKTHRWYANFFLVEGDIKL